MNVMNMMNMLNVMNMMNMMNMMNIMSENQKTVKQKNDSLALLKGIYLMLLQRKQFYK